MSEDINVSKNPYDYWNMRFDIKWKRKHTIGYPVPDPPKIPQYIINHLTNRLYIKMNYPHPLLEKVPIEKNQLEIEDSPYHYWEPVFYIQWVRKNTAIVEDVPKAPTVPYRFIELLNDEFYSMMDHYLWPEEPTPEIFIVGILILTVIGFLFYVLIQ